MSLQRLATLQDYESRLLGGINEPDRELAHCMLQCVAVAFRPLHVKELAQFLAFDFTARPSPKFDEHSSWRQKANAVRSMCSNLHSNVKVDGSSVVQFTDLAMKQQFTSLNLSDITPSPYNTPAHTRSAQACLGILFHLDYDVITRDGLQDFPFAEYAAKHWINHSRFQYVWQDVEEMVKCLFDPKKQHLAVLFWIHDPAIPSWKQSERADRPPRPRGTPLHYAALYGLPSIVNYLITECSLDVHSQTFDNKSTPLHVVSSRGHVEVTHVLLGHGANATARDKQGRTPLHGASYWGHAKLAHVLLEHAADAKAEDEHGSTPLHMACVGGRVEVVHLLIKHGADATAQDKQLMTPLHRASRAGQLEIVRFLLEHGAEAAAEDQFSWTPLHYSCIDGHLEVAHVLIRNRALVTVEDKVGCTPLHLASTGGYVELVRILLRNGADVTAQDKQGRSSLHKAAGKGHGDVTRILLQNGADIDAKDDQGQTPLHRALSMGDAAVAGILVTYGADREARDRYGRTPVDCASPRIIREHPQFLSDLSVPK
jgi:ankyrin repeat protein